MNRDEEVKTLEDVLKINTILMKGLDIDDLENIIDCYKKGNEIIDKLESGDSIKYNVGEDIIDMIKEFQMLYEKNTNL